MKTSYVIFVLKTYQIQDNISTGPLLYIMFRAARILSTKWQLCLILVRLFFVCFFFLSFFACK